MNPHTERLENQEIHWVLTLCLPLRENYFVGPKVAAFILYGKHYRRKKAQGFVGWKVLNLESKLTLAYTLWRRLVMGNADVNVSWRREEEFTGEKEEQTHVF